MEPQEPVPPVSWEMPPEPPAPRSGEPTGALHNHRSPSTFTIGDALTTGFGLVAKPTFIIPVLILGIIINTVVGLLIGPLAVATFLTLLRMYRRDFLS